MDDTNLVGVDGSSSKDVWAVGSVGHTNIHPVVGHWNGRQWIVQTQNRIDGALTGVSVISSTDAWAVGLYYDSPRPLIEHWNGSGWKLVSAPSPGSSSNVLSGVAAVSASDVWTVGYFEDPGRLVSLFLHWDGTAWTAFPPGPETTSEGILNGVSATSTGDVWAVGYKAGKIGFNTDPLIDHWDGSAWVEVPVELPPAGINSLWAASATENDAWAVGHTSTASLIEHWDGTAWRIVSGASTILNLSGVSGVAADDVWAVGNGVDEAGAEHWDGTTWTDIPAVTPGDSSAFFAVSALSDTDIWAVGSWGPALTEHSQGMCP